MVSIVPRTTEVLGLTRCQISRHFGSKILGVLVVGVSDFQGFGCRCPVPRVQRALFSAYRNVQKPQQASLEVSSI